MVLWRETLQLFKYVKISVVLGYSREVMMGEGNRVASVIMLTFTKMPGPMLPFTNMPGPHADTAWAVVG